MNSIYTYLDYREYLKDYYEFRKAENPCFSYRLFGRLVDMDPSLLAKVLMKGRHIADESISKFVDSCKLSGPEAEYFDNLVHFAKAKTDKQGKVYFERLLGLRTVSARRVENEQYRFYTKWYYSAIRSLLEFYEFRGDFKELAAQLNPAISAKEAKEAIELLFGLGLIQQDETLRWQMTDKAVTTGESWRSLAIQSFQEETIGLAKEALERHPKEHRDISSITMNVNQGNVAEIRERIREFRASLIQYVNDCTDPTSVYQLNLQLLPLTVVKEGEQ